MILKTGFVALALCAGATAPALAQSPPSHSAQGGDNLSSKLSKSGGVITPNEDVDPGMKVPAPDPHPNSTPVIPPSATGGNSAK